MPGTLPAVACVDRNARFSATFDDESAFNLHCRGQGLHYHTRHEIPCMLCGDGGDVLHFYFSGCFAGFCCFCALGSGLSPCTFARIGCFNCARKELLRHEFAKLYGTMEGTAAVQRTELSSSASWDSHGWGALPPALLDHILWFAMGLDTAGGKATVCEGKVCILD